MQPEENILILSRPQLPQNKKVVLQWIPAQNSIAGNKEEDWLEQDFSSPTPPYPTSKPKFFTNKTRDQSCKTWILYWLQPTERSYRDNRKTFLAKKKLCAPSSGHRRVPGRHWSQDIARPNTLNAEDKRIMEWIEAAINYTHTKNSRQCSTAEKHTNVQAFGSNNWLTTVHCKIRKQNCNW